MSRITDTQTIVGDDGNKIEVNIGEEESELYKNQPFERFRKRELKQYMWAHGIRFTDGPNCTKEYLVRICEAEHQTPKPLPTAPPTHAPDDEPDTGEAGDGDDTDYEPQGGGEQPDTKPDFDSMNVPQLRKVIRELGMDDPGKSATKAECLELINDHISNG